MAAASTAGRRPHAAFERGLGSVLLRTVLAVLPRRFDPEVAGELDAVVELRVRAVDGAVPDCHELVIKDGRCTVRRGAGGRADAALSLGAVDLLRLGTGVVRWHELMGANRLELSGDPFLAMRVPCLFRLLPARSAGGPRGRGRLLSRRRGAGS